VRCAEACAWGGGTILNAIPAWIGSAFPISLRVTAEACEADDVSVETYANVDTGPIREIARRIVTRLGLRGVRIRIGGDLPPIGGLKSSSATVNAVILAIHRLAGHEPDPVEVAKMNAVMSREVGISVTGAFDDALASILGRAVVTDNARLEVLKVFDLGLDTGLVLTPPWHRGRPSADRLKLMRPVAEAAAELVLRGDWRRAMLINALAVATALGYPLDPVMDALELGAVGGVSGTGPAHVFLPLTEELSNRLTKYGEVKHVNIVQGMCRPA